MSESKGSQSLSHVLPARSKGVDSRRLKPFVGGFVLSEGDLGEVANFRKQKLPNGLNWWSDDAVSEEFVQGDSENFLLIRGHWSLTSPKGEGKDTASYLLARAQDDLDKFHEELEYLSGRYVILVGLSGKTYLYNDTLGARTVYYSVENRIVASHLRILQDLDDYENFEVEKGLKVVQWAADFTPAKGIFNLLPNFFLELPSFEVSRFYPRRENPFLAADRDEKYAEIERIWHCSQRSYFEDNPDVAFSITGGIDSRLVLAMAKPYWHKLTGYTYGEPSHGKKRGAGGTFYRRTMLSDDRIVRVLLESVQFKDHIFIDVTNRAAVGKDLLGLLEKNSYGSHGQHLVASYQEIFRTGKWLNIRGNAIELARMAHAKPGFNGRVTSAQREFPADVDARLEYLGYRSNFHGYGKQLLFYWELRHGKWLGEIHNELDAAFDTWIPAANRRILDLMSAFPEDELKSGIVIRDLIERNAPELNWQPVNSGQSLYQEWRELNLQTSGMIEARFVLDENGNARDLPAQTYSRIPETWVGPRSRLVIRFAPFSETGTLAFRVVVPYSNPAGKDYFSWGIRINGVSHFSIDGAERGVPINFSVDNVTPNDEILVEMEFLKSVTGVGSWSEATRISVDGCKFYPRKVVDAKPALRCDWDG
ncbi:hypothetical protein [Corynebacterium lehmanniae]